MRPQGTSNLLLLICAGWLFISTSAFTQSQAVHPRIISPVDESQLITLKGNTHPLARAEFDRGPAPADLPMQRMLLVLKRGSEQEATLQKLLDDQQDKVSPNFHKWLTPEDFGQQFGPADQDIQTITSWLQSHGFEVERVSKGHTVIEFSGNAAQVQEAFHAAIHKFTLNGEDHWANASDPQIPAALAPVIGGVLSFNNFRSRPLYHNLGVVSRSKATGTFTPAQPLFTIPDSNGCGVQTSNCYGVGPYDFATIYNVLPLWTSAPAINGTGQTIAIVGETDINPQDVTDFRTFFGLPAPNLQVIHDGPAPGILQDGEETESDLDVEWSGAVAPGATIDFVVAESTETTQGIHLSALYIIDNNLAPVVSESYGQCELYLGAAGNQFFNQLWQQAAAQGITVMIASGDQGSAVCDRADTPAPTPAKNGLEVSGYSSTPYNVAVGGTDFTDLTNATTYWNATNNSTTQASANSYIPESTWNDSCTNSVFGTLLGYTTNPETNCNNPRLVNFVGTFGGSGGKSSCISSDGQNPSSCSAGYPKPSWQSSLTPNDGARDVPDVSLFAAVGLAGSFYVICEADQSGAACNPNAPTADFLGVGGTSASAPAFAGIMALVNQQTGSRQGNANYVLYKLAAQQPSAFHDVTTGTIAMPCQTGSPNCTTSTPGDAYGVLSGYNATAGYDLATGLGSVNAFNLVTKWSSVTLAPSVTTLSSLTPTTITHGQPVSVDVGVAPQSGTGTPAGTVALVGGATGSVTDFDSHTLTGGAATWTTSLLPGGSYNVTAHYPGDGNYSSSDSATGVPVIVNKESSKVALGLVTFDLSGHVLSSNATTAIYGSPYILRVGVTGTTCSSNSLGQAGCPTGNVTLTDNGSPLDAGTYALNSLGYAEDQPIQLPGGSHSLQVGYPGDNSFIASTATTAIGITPANTTIATPSVAAASVGTPVQLNTTIQASSTGLAPTGTVTFFANGTAISGTPAYSSTPGTGSGTATLSASLTSSSSPFSVSGGYTITATYSGDTNYAGATSTGTTVQVKYPTPSLTIQVSTFTPTAGSSVTFTARVGGLSTTVGPTGTVSYSGTLGPITSPVTYSTVTDANGYLDLQAVITFTPTASDGFNVSYSGDANYPATFVYTGPINVMGTDFSLSFIGPSTMTMSAGDSSLLTNLGVSVQTGAAPVTFSSTPCTGLPAEATCSVYPTSNLYTTMAQVSVVTMGPHTLARPSSGTADLLRWESGFAVGLVGIFLIGGAVRKRCGTALLSIILVASLVAMISCGGGSSNADGGGGGGGGGGATDPGTPKGTYTITVTATSGTITHTANFQLVVQ
jgi:hypothetical protein